MNTIFQIYFRKFYLKKGLSPTCLQISLAYSQSHFNLEIKENNAGNIEFLAWPLMN